VSGPTREELDGLANIVNSWHFVRSNPLPEELDRIESLLRSYPLPAGEGDGWTDGEPPLDEWVIVWVLDGNSGTESWTPAVFAAPDRKHAYPDQHGTSDCSRGCGAWMGPFSSGGPDPFGTCPRAPTAPTWLFTYKSVERPELEVLAWRPGPSRPRSLASAGERAEPEALPAGEGERRRLYRVTFDGEEHFVEAATMDRARAAWLGAMRAEWGAEWEGDEEPEEIVLIHDGAVLREVRYE